MDSIRLPLVYLYRKVVFPHCNLAFPVRSKSAARLKQGEKICALPVRGLRDFLPFRARLATIAEVLDVKGEGETAEITVKGVSRARIVKLAGVFSAIVKPVPEEGGAQLERVREELRKKAQELIFLINVDESDKLIHLLNFLVNLHQLTDFISNYFILRLPRRFEVFMETDVEKRAGMLLSTLDVLIDELKNKRGQQGAS
ncbi:MAG: hypothetical protein EPN93_10730 [Spirochaetes bacterium]|nr:MAG: hypothetical protein EPN93_10730 [Spirochaetota bacterium]